jgi:hypothetical protein
MTPTTATKVPNRFSENLDRLLDGIPKDTVDPARKEELLSRWRHLRDVIRAVLDHTTAKLKALERRSVVDDDDLNLCWSITVVKDKTAEIVFAPRIQKSELFVVITRQGHDGERVFSAAECTASTIGNWVISVLLDLLYR